MLRHPIQELSPAGGLCGCGQSRGGHPASGRPAPQAVAPRWGLAVAGRAGAGEEVNRMRGTTSGTKARGSGAHRNSEKAKTEQRAGKMEAGEWGRPLRDEVSPGTRPG